LPLRHRHGYAAVLHRGLPTGKINPIQEFPPEWAVRTAIQPRSTGFELAEVLRGFTPLVPRVHLPVSLAGPTPSGSAGASRRCRGCFHPVQSSHRTRLPPASTAPLRRSGGAGLTPAHGSQRLVAHGLSPPLEQSAPHGARVGIPTWGSAAPAGAPAHGEAGVSVIVLVGVVGRSSVV
jgi:hypothetical protein